ncbi:MAG TPA: hypothetical protein ENG51_19290 [Deltaproteobacteria bacterium]|nr:hypothetical protein [Deltaproteobacteria bacterium]
MGREKRSLNYLWIIFHSIAVLWFVVAPMEKRGISMEYQWMPIKELIQVVEANQQVQEMIPDELARSYPVLVRKNGKYLVAFMFFFKKGMPPDPPQISTPRYLLLADPVTGEVVSLTRVTPSDFGIDLPESKPLGVHTLGKKMTMDEFLEMKSQLISLYDEVFGIYRNYEGSVSPEERKVLSNFVRLFDILVEKPLLPFYKALNPEFFSWLKKHCK